MPGGAAAEARPRDARLGAGSVIGEKWRLERILGEGGLGIVWEAAHTSMDRRVAVKLLKSADGPATPRFLREARVTTALRDPHIVRVHDVFVVAETGSPAMVMELLSGTTLARCLQQSPDRRLPLSSVAAIGSQITDALTAAHREGVVHRDIKPDNIFLVGTPPSIAQPWVKVLDFGLAKLTAKDGTMASTGRLTRTGSVLGTAHYMAPEQVGTEDVVDARADIWALGVVLYECASGTRPIEGRSLTDVLRAIAEADIVPLAKRAPDLPRGFGRLVGRMLSRDKRRRPLLDDVRAELAAHI
jgi:serine/threonine-protein kinase